MRNQSYGLYEFDATADGADNGLTSNKAKITDQTNEVHIRVSMFFDGTRNNLYNTKSRLEYAKNWQSKESEAYRKMAEEHKGFDTSKDYLEKADDSYHNDYTNVARLYQHYLKESTSEIRTGCVYVEGIGTLKHEQDHPTLGGGFGDGPTGILEKVKMGCKGLADEIETLAGGKNINSICIDVFGFSRGAAAARNFIYEITQDKIPAHYVSSGYPTFPNEVPEQPAFGQLGVEMKKLTIEYKGKIKILFAGLFDTVATYWFYKELGVKFLHLDAVKQAKDVLHLTAMDERRANFSLTDVTKSKGAKFEKALPGVHSDIGGSYNPIEVNRGKIVYSGDYYKMEDEKRYLIEDGWYSEGNGLELHLAKVKTGMSLFNPVSVKSGLLKGYITVDSKTIQNEYSFIPLHIMKDKARNGFNQIKFILKYIDDKFKIPVELSYTSQRLNNYVFNGAKPMEFYSRQVLDKLVYLYNLKYKPVPFIPEPQIAVRSSIQNVVPREEQLMRQKETEQADRLKDIERNKDLEARDYPNDPDLQQKINDHYTIKALRSKYLHTSHYCSALADWTNDNFKFFDPYAESIRTKPSRYIIPG